jgi:hypothetical protein
MNRVTRFWLVLIPLLTFAPLLGAMLTGASASDCLVFPPFTQWSAPQPFSPGLFVLVAALTLVVTAFFVRGWWRSRSRPPAAPRRRYRFPSWSWLGVVLIAVFWTLAWTQLGWFEAGRHFTFTPLWLGYVIAVNALVYRRTGSCPALDRPVGFFLLFPASGLLWWYFEYLNGYTRSWHYLGTGIDIPALYVLAATPSFMTMLPAVVSTLALLRSTGAFARRWQLPAVRPRRPRLWAWTALLVAALALMLSAVWPDYLYPAIWLSPLVLYVALKALVGLPTGLEGLTRGDWRVIYQPAVAALLCGLVWEMWNYRSVPKWIYSVDFLHAFLVFEMPVLGLTGYLPFGVLCWLVAEDVFRAAAPLESHPSR